MLKLSLKKIFTILLFSLSCFIANAQEKVEMAEGMRSNGKIYVVVAVLSIILIGILLFLVNIDRKVSKLEKEKQRQ